MTATTAADRSDRAFLGHPKALGYLAFTEAWERFSYYGMQSLLVLYMTKQLLLTPHVERIAGFSAFESFIQSVYHPGLSTQAISSAILQPSFRHARSACARRSSPAGSWTAASRGSRSEPRARHATPGM